MTDFEILLTIVCVFLIGWCWFLQKVISVLQRAVVQLQGVAITQVAINAQNAEVRSILEDVNASLLKIVDDGK
jgi:hypothetical protein